MSRLKPCIAPRCTEYALEGRAYCAQHWRERWSRGLTGARIVDSSWHRARRAILRAQRGRCAECGKAATTVHHIDGDARNDQLDNLQALCERCHAAKHGKTRRVGSAS